MRLECYAAAGQTLVPNVFIDKYMAEANGEFVKVYLCLLRTQGTAEISVESLAERLDLSERSVDRALKYLENGGRTDFFNLGTNEGSTVREVFSTCERITGRSIPLEMGDRRPGDPASLVADNKKARAILGWNPIRTLEDSIRTAYAWEKKKGEP